MPCVLTSLIVFGLYWIKKMLVLIQVVVEDQGSPEPVSYSTHEIDVTYFNPTSCFRNV